MGDFLGEVTADISDCMGCCVGAAVDGSDGEAPAGITDGLGCCMGPAVDSSDGSDGEAAVMELCGEVTVDISDGMGSFVEAAVDVWGEGRSGVRRVGALPRRRAGLFFRNVAWSAYGRGPSGTLAA